MKYLEKLCVLVKSKTYSFLFKKIINNNSSRFVSMGGTFFNRGGRYSQREIGGIFASGSYDAMVASSSFRITIVINI